MALRSETPLAHCRSVVGVPGDLLGTPLDDGTALHITSPHAHAAAAGEGRPLVAEQHAREFLGQQNPTNQQISVNSLPPLAEIFCASSSLQHTDNVVAPLDAIIKGEYRCGYCQQTVLSTSGHSCGRTPHIRCDCGGIKQDGKRRLHSKWTTVKSPSLISLEVRPYPRDQGLTMNLE